MAGVRCVDRSRRVRDGDNERTARPSARAQDGPARDRTSAGDERVRRNFRPRLGRASRRRRAARAVATTSACSPAITTASGRAGVRLFGRRMRFRQSPEDKLAFVGTRATRPPRADDRRRPERRRRARRRRRRHRGVGRNGLHRAGLRRGHRRRRLAELPAFLRFAAPRAPGRAACASRCRSLYNVVGLDAGAAGDS